MLISTVLEVIPSIHVNTGLAENVLKVPDEKDLGVLIDEKLKMSRQCVLAAQKPNHILPALHQNSMASSMRKVFLPVYTLLS